MGYISGNNCNIQDKILIIFYLMNYHRKNNGRNKLSTSSLINFEDFVKYREEKEKIINNPFEENWKKAIVIEELLKLYKPQENNFTPHNSTYDRKDFQYFYKPKPNLDQEDSIWQNNEDCQFKKLYKMADGIENFEEIYENRKIAITAQKVDDRKAILKNIKNDKEQTTKLQKKNKKVKCLKQSKKYFRNENFKQYQLLIDFKERNKKNFDAEKNEIKRLQKKAFDQYEITFAKEAQIIPANFNQEEYKKRQDIIFHKFISPPTKIKKQQKVFQKSNDEMIRDSSYIPPRVMKELSRPSTSCQSTPMNCFKRHKSTQWVTRKTYIRIPND